MNLKVNYILPGSKANGPGTRYTIWTQGCSIHCPGCSNKDTWPFEGGKEYSVDDIIEDIIVKSSIQELDGVTITGGEPLDQFEAVYELLKRLPDISKFLTTGYTSDQIKERGYWPIINLLDIICTGPFKADKICSGEWKGSFNQNVTYLTSLGEIQSKMPVILKEVYIGKSGQAIETGFTV